MEGDGNFWDSNLPDWIENSNKDRREKKKAEERETI